MKYTLFSLALITILYLLGACSASKDSRYETEKKVTDEETRDTIVSIQEDFDISPYLLKMDIEDFSTDAEVFSDVWYQYESLQDDSIFAANRNITGTVDGYRVMVIVTDNMEEANSVREDISSQISRKEVYISFEPPFYKVKVGDFTNIAEANDLKFKLNQLGYTAAKVVQETVNLFNK